MKSPPPPRITIGVVAPGDKVAMRKRRPTEAEIGLSADLSQFYGMKATLERLFGRSIFLKVKDGGSFSAWRKATHRLLDALDLAISETVAVVDPEWRAEIAAALEHGRESIRRTNTMADLFAALAATLANVAFLQLGMMPSHATRRDAVPLRPDHWKLSAYRSVQYVQDDHQKEALAARRTRQRQAAEHSDQAN